MRGKKPIFHEELLRLSKTSITIGINRENVFKSVDPARNMMVL